MAAWPGLIDVFQTAWGKTPAEVMSARRTVAEPDLQHLLTVHAQWTPPSHTPAPGTLWPLVSHHTFPSATELRGLRAEPAVLTSRLLVQLLGCHGLVLADPLRSVAVTYDRLGAEKGLQALTDVVARLAHLQPLLAAGVLHVTTASPTLTDPDRVAVLNAFRLDDLSVFSGMTEWGEFVQDDPAHMQRKFVAEVVTLYSVMGVPAPDLGFCSVMKAKQAVAELAAALIELSWQVSVCAREPTCDIFVGDGLERRLLDALMKKATDGDMADIGADAGGPLRHMERLAAGALPLPDASRFNTADALALRHDNSFEQWRLTLNKALDRYETSLTTFGREQAARSSFIEAMQEASAELRRDARRSSFADRFSEESVPAGVGVVGAAAMAASGSLPEAAGWAAATGATAVLWKWFRARSKTSTNVMHRYVALFGGLPR